MSVIVCGSLALKYAFYLTLTFGEVERMLFRRRGPYLNYPKGFSHPLFVVDRLRIKGDTNMSLHGKTAIVVGGSRGLGRGDTWCAVEALAAPGRAGRRGGALASVASGVKGVVPVPGAAMDERIAERLLREHAPDLFVVSAGGRPPLGAFHDMTWEEFEANLHVDAKLAFAWALGGGRRLRIGEALAVVPRDVRGDRDRIATSSPRRDTSTSRPSSHATSTRRAGSANVFRSS